MWTTARGVAVVPEVKTMSAVASGFGALSMGTGAAAVLLESVLPESVLPESDGVSRARLAKGIAPRGVPGSHGPV